MTTSAHIAVALLVDDGRVLLVHRTTQRVHHPNVWSLPGGHVEGGESPEMAVTREVHEELGVEIRRVTPVRLLVDDPAVVMHAFAATSWDGAPRNLAPEEHDALLWCAPDDLRHLELAHPEGVSDMISAMQACAEGDLTRR